MDGQSSIPRECDLPESPDFTIDRLGMSPQTETGIGDVLRSPDLLAAHQLEAHSMLGLEAAGVGTWSWEIASDSLIWDPLTHKLFGINQGEFSEQRKEMETFIHPEDRRRVRAEVVRCVQTDADFNSEYRVIWPKDRSVHFLRARGRIYRDKYGKAVRMTGACWDITERKTMEEELARERFLLRTLMQHIPDKIYFKDVASRFIWVSHETLARFGSNNPADVLGKTDFDFFKEEHARQAFENEQEIIRTGKPLVNLEERETWADGRETWVSTTKMPLIDGEGRIIGTFGLSRDITDHKRAEEQLARYAGELQRRNKELEEDLEMARELQSALMPQRYPVFPHDAGPAQSDLQFAHFFNPSMAVSGDFFHILDLSDSCAGVFVCDVMGHGVRAALVAAIVRALVGELKSVAGEPGEFLGRLNRKLFAILTQTRIPMFASASYVVAEVAKGELRYANAGHPEPLCIRGEGGERKAMPFHARKRDPVLGIFEQADYATSRATLSVGDVVLLFTDGLFEVESSTGMLYDEKLLIEAVNRHANLKAATLLKEVISEVQQFAADKHFSDDVCLVSMEVERLRS